MIEIVPLYALGQISRNEKYIQTSIANWNLHLLTKSFNRWFQEEIDTRPDSVSQIKFHLSQVILGKLGTFFRPDGIDGWPIGQGK